MSSESAAMLACLETPGRARAVMSWVATFPARAGLALTLFSPLAIVSVFFSADARGEVPVVRTFSDGSDEDQDDMCVWVHPSDPTRSTLITSDKTAGTVYVYDLAGNVLQSFASPQPGNIDVRYGFRLGADCVDLVAFNERSENRIRVYKVNPLNRRLERVDDGTIVTSGGNYGFTLYRHADGRLFAHTGPDGNGSVVRQYELLDDGAGRIRGLLTGWLFDETTVEGMAGDDETGYLYLGEEGVGIWRVRATDASDKTLISEIGDASGLAGDVEGIAIYYAGGGAGYIIASSQGADKYTILERRPPHRSVGEFQLAGVGSSDGIDVLNMNLGTPFSQGIFVAHNGAACCPVQAARWADVASEVGGLIVDTAYWDPRQSNRSCEPSDNTTTTTTLPAAAPVTLEEVETGTSSSSSSVSTSAAVTDAPGALYLAAVATKPATAVTGLSGLGLVWTQVVEQCSGRAQTSASLWMAAGSPSVSGTVSASLQASAISAVIAVSRYSGVEQAEPLGAVASANTNGDAGMCAGGVDSASYAFDLGGSGGATVYAAAAMRHASHTPGAGFIERTEIHSGTLGNVASLAVEDSGDGPVESMVAGSFDGAIDWAAVAAELRGTQTVSLPALCSPVPEAPQSCRVTAPGKSSLRLSEKKGRSVGWTWKQGAATELDSFGNPLAGTAQYRLCLYDSRGGTQLLAELGLKSGGNCRGKPCWTAVGPKGFRYRDPDASPAGVTAAKLRPGTQGKAQIQVRAHGSKVPALGLEPSGLELPVTAQFLVIRDPVTECWETTFVAAKRNDPTFFQAVGP